MAASCSAAGEQSPDWSKLRVCGQVLGDAAVQHIDLRVGFLTAPPRPWGFWMMHNQWNLAPLLHLCKWRNAFCRCGFRRLAWVISWEKALIKFMPIRPFHRKVWPEGGLKRPESCRDLVFSAHPFGFPSFPYNIFQLFHQWIAPRLMRKYIYTWRVFKWTHNVLCWVTPAVNRTDSIGLKTDSNFTRQWPHIHCTSLSSIRGQINGLHVYRGFNVLAATQNALQYSWHSPIHTVIAIQHRISVI